MNTHSEKLLQELDFVITYRDREQVLELIQLYMAKAYAEGYTDSICASNNKLWNEKG